MNQIGYTALLLAVMLAAYGAVMPVVGARLGRRDLIQSGLHSAYALAAVVGVAAVVLWIAMMTRDYSNYYVWQYTSNDLNGFYTFSAFWAGNAGSLLLWLLLLAGFSATVVYQNRVKNRELVPYVVSVLMVVSLFFGLLLVAFEGSNPFEANPMGSPAQGNGLNPMLENPGMVIHPVATYLGYVGFAVPFAFAMAALITKRLGDFWIRSTRRWTLAGWFFLTIGNLVGAWWAYVTLGWGGFWAWDPVENASFMPWLTGTAFLHSVMIQEKKDMLKVWNIVLIIMTFTLTIFGTFLTRSGIINSVHSFGQASVGPYFIAFMALTLVFSLNLLFSRLDLLKSRNELDSLLSRESSFLMNNLLLVGMAGTVLWGVLWPILSEAITGDKQTVGPPFFDTVIRPIGLVFMFLTGICPLIAWRRATFANLSKNFMYPGGTAAVVLVALLAFGMTHVWALIAFTLSAFVLGTIFMEFARGTLVRREMTGDNIFKAFTSLVRRNKRRYGGYIVHAGVILFLIGVTGHYSFQEKAQNVQLAKGEAVTVGDYTVTYEEFSSFNTDEKSVGQAVFRLEEDGKFLGTAEPVREFYFAKDQPWTRVDRHSTLLRDVYVSLMEYEAPDGATITVDVSVNPLTSWLWIGGIVATLGGLIALWPDRREERRLAARYERQARLHEV